MDLGGKRLHVGLRKRVVNTLQNHSSNLLAMLGQDRGVISREHIDIVDRPGQCRSFCAAPVVTRMPFLIDKDQRNAARIFFRDMCVEQTPVANLGLIKTIHLARL